MENDNPKAVSPDAIHGFDLAGITVRDAKKTIAFYRDVLGLTPSMEDGDSAEFELADGATFGIVVQPQGGRYPFGWGALFGVKDIKAAVKLMRERGAQLSDAIETPVCFMAFGEDPEGNKFVVHQRKNP